MNVLVLGSGGREHAISWKIAQSSLLSKLFIAPGNGGTDEIGTNINLKVTDFKKIGEFCLENDVKMVVVGPEDPLVKGINNYFSEKPKLNHITIIGPSKEGAMLEGSKHYAKEFMRRHNIPTAASGTFTTKNIESGIDFLETLSPPYVLKADGLAAGKGVLIIDDLKEAQSALRDMLTKEKFGEASSKVVIEEFLDGIELSVFVLTDGDSYKILPEAKDYKRIGEGDKGLNTGGMGAISPVPFAGKDFMQAVENSIIIPTIDGLKKDGIDYQGFIFIGLMNVDGSPYVIEYNVRMGDPETEVVIPRLETDLLHLFDGIATKTLSECDIKYDEHTCATVMMVSGGYPEAYEKGKKIGGIEEVKGSLVFHAGTKKNKCELVTNGGRVLAISSFGIDIPSATKKSFENIEKISFDKAYYRPDIGLDLI